MMDDMDTAAEDDDMLDPAAPATPAEGTPDEAEDDDSAAPEQPGAM